MGARCQHYFEEANRLGGLVAKMRLASFAQITSMEAGTVPDSTELTVRLDAALARVRSEFASPDPAATAPKGPTATAKLPAVSAELLRRYLSVLAELFSQRSLFTGDLDATVRRMTETACSTLDIERVSVWFLDAARTKIVCADLFQRTSAEHSAGVELMATDFAPYFEARPASVRYWRTTPTKTRARAAFQWSTCSRSASAPCSMCRSGRAERWWACSATSTWVESATGARTRRRSRTSWPGWSRWLSNSVTSPGRRLPRSSR
jgi:hypothetical protein